MSTEQKCKWVCDLCGKTDSTYNENTTPLNWCKASLHLRWNQGRGGRGTLAPTSDWSSGYIDVCNECYYNRKETRNYDGNWSEHQSKIRRSFIQRLWLKIVSPKLGEIDDK